MSPLAHVRETNVGPREVNFGGGEVKARWGWEWELVAGPTPARVVEVDSRAHGEVKSGALMYAQMTGEKSGMGERVEETLVVLGFQQSLIQIYKVVVIQVE